MDGRLTRRIYLFVWRFCQSNESDCGCKIQLASAKLKYLRNHKKSRDNLNVNKFSHFMIYNSYSKTFPQIALQKRENRFWSFFRCAICNILWQSFSCQDVWLIWLSTVAIVFRVDKSEERVSWPDLTGSSHLPVDRTRAQPRCCRFKSFFISSFSVQCDAIRGINRLNGGEQKYPTSTISEERLRCLVMIGTYELAFCSNV